MARWRRRRDGARVLRARRLELVDTTGAVRVVAGELATGGHGVAVLDLAGHARVWVALEPTGPAIVVSQNGNIVAEAGAHDATDDALQVGAYAYLADPDGVPQRFA